MKTPNLALVWLAEGEDLAAAKAIEAGLYAHHLIAQGATDSRLKRVVDAGRRAMDVLWGVGIRVARKIACRVALAAKLTPDDLFQEACLSVAQAIRAFDHTLGVRFTTFVYHVIRRALSDSPLSATGAVGSRADRRATRKALLAQGQSPGASLSSAAAAIGVSASAVARGSLRRVPLEGVVAEDVDAQHRMTRAVETSVDFLALLAPRHRRILELRLREPRYTLALLAEALGVSVSTAYRWDREALLEARAVLEADRTTAPPPAGRGG